MVNWKQKPHCGASHIPFPVRDAIWGTTSIKEVYHEIIQRPPSQVSIHFKVFIFSGHKKKITSLMFIQWTRQQNRHSCMCGTDGHGHGCAWNSRDKRGLCLWRGRQPSFADVIFDHISYICSSHHRYFCWGSLILPIVSVMGAWASHLFLILCTNKDRRAKLTS